MHKINEMNLIPSLKKKIYKYTNKGDAKWWEDMQPTLKPKTPMKKIK